MIILCSKILIVSVANKKEKRKKSCANLNRIKSNMGSWWLELFCRIKTDKLIKFLRDIDLLDESDLEILDKEKIWGLDFISFSIEDYRRCGLKWGPATRLAKAAWEIKNKNGILLPPNTCAVLSTLSQSLGQPPVSGFTK